MDPISAMATASAAFGAIKKGFQVGRDIESMASDLSRWMGAMSDLDMLEKEAKNPPIFKKLFAGKSVEQEAIETFASEIKVSKPSSKNTGEKSLYHTFTAEYNNKEKWKTFLYFVNDEANKRVKDTITKRFETILAVQTQIKNFAIRDIETEINNLEKDYEIITNNRFSSNEGHFFNSTFCADYGKMLGIG